MFKNFLKGTALVLALGLAASSARADDGISIANGKAKFDALGQFWFVNDTSLGKETNSSGISNGGKTNMYVRRAELQFSGNLNDTTHWGIMLDPAKAQAVNGQNNNNGAATMLQDVTLAWDLVPGFTLQVGQFKTLTTAEGLEADGTQLFFERSMLAREWGDSHQPGIMVSYKQPMWKVGLMVSNGGDVSSTGVVGNNIGNNGTGLSTVDPQNINDPNNKEITARVDVKPCDMASFGAWTEMPRMNFGQGGAFGGNITANPSEDFMVRVEGVRGWSKGNAALAAVWPNTPSPVTNSKNGYYVDAAYTYGDWQPAVRYETMQAGTTDRNEVTGSAFTFGINYYMMKHSSKIQASYSMLGGGVSGSNIVSQQLGAGTTSSIANGQYGPQPSAGGGLFVLAFQMSI